MDVLRIAEDKFEPEDELFLFGNPGDGLSDEQLTAVISLKHALAFGWLAQYWEEEVPDFVFEDLQSARAWEAFFDGGWSTKQELFVRQDPISWALYEEWYNSFVLDFSAMQDRALFSTALYYAYVALKDDALRDEKLSYVVDIFTEMDDHKKHEYNLPPPIQGYSEEPFPLDRLNK